MNPDPDLPPHRPRMSTPRPRGAWQSPEPETRQSERASIAIAAIAFGSLVAICGILAWFLAEIIPG